MANDLADSRATRLATFFSVFAVGYPNEDRPI
jgi:hypothetical protein